VFVRPGEIFRMNANGSKTTAFNTAVVIDLSCTDPDGNPLTYLRGSPGNGTVSNQTTIFQASGLSPFSVGARGMSANARSGLVSPLNSPTATA
jgi:hypothetical protein